MQKKELEVISWADISGQKGASPSSGNAAYPGATAATPQTPVIMLEYRDLYEQNRDLIGWLSIDGTVIDYPVMQCPEDEEFYLTHNFYKEESRNGCLILDNDSQAGVGLQVQNYANGIAPSTNLIIHGHTMRSGQMFGSLRLYEDEEYGMSHSTICFDSLYERREYELIGVFYSQVFYENEDVFKYYRFFQADTQEAFDDWYSNIKELSLYDTGVTAEFGDEFITLSCCAYHVENGRFVVVGKRIQ
ncbi:MAG: class B sortase [Lachnospiraceae bacterium]